MAREEDYEVCLFVNQHTRYWLDNYMGGSRVSNQHGGFKDGLRITAWQWRLVPIPTNSKYYGIQNLASDRWMESNSSTTKIDVSDSKTTNVSDLTRFQMWEFIYEDKNYQILNVATSQYLQNNPDNRYELELVTDEWRPQYSCRDWIVMFTDSFDASIAPDGYQIPQMAILSEKRRVAGPSASVTTTASSKGAQALELSSDEDEKIMKSLDKIPMQATDADADDDKSTTKTGYDFGGASDVHSQFDKLVPDENDQLLMVGLAHKERWDTLSKYSSSLGITEADHYKVESIANHVALHTYPMRMSRVLMRKATVASFGSYTCAVGITNNVGYCLTRYGMFASVWNCVDDEPPNTINNGICGNGTSATSQTGAGTSGNVKYKWTIGTVKYKAKFAWAVSEVGGVVTVEKAWVKKKESGGTLQDTTDYKITYSTGGSGVEKTIAFTIS